MDPLLCNFEITTVGDSFNITRDCKINNHCALTYNNLDGLEVLLEEFFCNPDACVSCLESGNEALDFVLKKVPYHVISRVFTDALIKGQKDQARMIFEKHPVFFPLDDLCRDNDLKAVMLAFEVCNPNVFYQEVNDKGGVSPRRSQIFCQEVYDLGGVGPRRSKIFCQEVYDLGGVRRRKSQIFCQEVYDLGGVRRRKSQICHYGSKNTYPSFLLNHCIKACYEGDTPFQDIINFLLENHHLFETVDVLRTSYIYNFVDTIREVMKNPGIPRCDKKIHLIHLLNGDKTALLEELIAEFPWVGIDMPRSHTQIDPNVIARADISVMELLWGHFPELDDMVLEEKDFLKDLIARTFAHCNLPVMRFLLERYPEGTEPIEIPAKFTKLRIVCEALPKKAHPPSLSQVQQMKGFMNKHLPLFGIE